LIGWGFSFVGDSYGNLILQILIMVSMMADDFVFRYLYRKAKYLGETEPLIENRNIIFSLTYSDLGYHYVFFAFYIFIFY
jgi:hypothetical protein